MIENYHIGNAKSLFIRFCCSWVIPTIFFFCISSPSFSQNKQLLKFSRLSLEEGLSQSIVYQTIQDSDGFLWFGTQDGLNKYDGYKFTVYRNDPDDPLTLSNNCVLSILEDRCGNFWIGTRGGGVNRFDKKTERFFAYKNNPKDSLSLSNNYIHCLFEDSDGTIWVGTNGGGLNKFDRKTGAFKVFKNNSTLLNSISNDIVTSIIEEDQNTLWIGTLGGGLNRFDKKTETFKAYKHFFYKPNGISNDNVKSIFIDSEGFLWAGTNGGGLNRLNRSTDNFDHYQNNPNDPHSLSNDNINAIYETSSGMLCIATHGGGLNILNKNTGKFEVYKKDVLRPESLSSNYPLSLFEDRSKTLWIGTFGGGLSSYSKYRTKFNVFKFDPLNPKSISSNAIRGFCIDKSNVLWIGTRGGGLNRYNASKGEFIAYKNTLDDSLGLSSNEIYRIIEDYSDILWVGTNGGGLNKFDSRTGKSRSFLYDPANKQSISSNSIYTLLDDNRGSIWIGTDGGGLNRFDKFTEKFTVYKNNPKDSLSISDNIIISIYKDIQGKLWLGTRLGGLNIFDPKTGKSISYKYNHKDKNSIPNNSVLSIVEDIYGTIWIGTDGGGLNRVGVDSKGRLRFKSYNTHDGLPNDCIYGIICDKKGRLWLSTNKGISRFSPYSDSSGRIYAEKPLIQNFDFFDGIPSNEFNTNAYYQSQNGTIYLGTIAGVVYFHPDSVVENFYKPPVVITGFQLFNKNVEVAHSNKKKLKKNKNARILYNNGNYYLTQSISKLKGITLSSNEKVFTLEFASLDFSIPQKNKYEYIMEGFDKVWSSIGTRRFATYTNLPNGKYTFKVRATNCDNVWSDSITSIKIEILPPYWKTLWFRLLLLFTTLSLIYLYIKQRERKLKDDKDILEATVKERTIQLKDANEELNLQNEKISSQRDNLQILIDELTQKNEEILAQRDEIHKQSKLIEQKNLNITASIAYAENIQHSILPEVFLIQKLFPDSFILYKPKDIVSGDFYWLYETDEKVFFAVIDCTGHGVPGALMSVMGYAFLRKAIHESINLTPADILTHLSIEINSTLRKSDKNANIKDGMDLALCALHKKTLMLEYAGAHNPILVLRDSKVYKIKADNHPVGDPFTSRFSGFNNINYQLNKKDIVYLFTDGLIDQFGGPKGQKYSMKQFERIIIDNSSINLNKQKEIIENSLEHWRNDYIKVFDQTDDITLLGIRIA